MSQSADRTLHVEERNELVPAEAGKGSYCLVNPRRSRKQVAVIIDPPIVRDFEDDVPTREIRPLAASPSDDALPAAATVAALAEGTKDFPALPREETRVTRRFRRAELLAAEGTPLPATDAAPTRYRDPDLCSCRKMTEALASKAIVVIWAGPVTLPPALADEEERLHGAGTADRAAPSYDGRTFAFRHCPWNGCTIDGQVAIVPQVENMTCCGTMHLAVAHGRVELPDPSRLDVVVGRFVHHDRPSILFSWCPWCATEIIDLAIARHKRAKGL